MVAKLRREGGGGYMHTYALTNGFLVSALWGPEYPVICHKFGFKLLRGSIPSTKMPQMKLTFFISEIQALKVSEPRQGIAILYIIFYIIK